MLALFYFELFSIHCSKDLRVEAGNDRDFLEASHHSEQPSSPKYEVYHFGVKAICFLWGQFKQHAISCH